MTRGEERLRIELARRRAEAAGDRAVMEALPQPPGPTFPHDLLGRTGRGARRTRQ